MSTPTPWYRRGPLAEDECGVAGGVPVDIVAVSDDDETVALLDELSVDDADFIVKAVNNHDALVAALRDILTVITLDDLIPESVSFMRQARAALQSASGSPEDAK